MKKIRKFAVGLGTLASISVPMAIVSCGDDDESKDKVSKFDFSADLAKVLSTATSSKMGAALMTDVGSLKAGAPITAEKLGLADQNLTTGVNATFVVKTAYDEASGTLVVTETLKKGDEKSATKDVTINAKMSQADIDKVQTDNLAALKTKLTGGAVTSVTDKASVIATRITDVAKLLTETGIDLTGLAATSTYVVSAEGTPEGVVTVKVVMTTTGATTPVSAEVPTTVTQKSDVDLASAADKVIKDALQKTNLAALKAKLTGGAVTSVTDKASVIATRITDAAKLLTETGIDLTGLATTSTYVVSAEGTPEGVVTVKVVMTTLGATTPVSSPSVTLEIQHTSDAILMSNANTTTLASDLTKLENTATSSSNHETLKASVGTLTKGKKVSATNLGFTEPSFSEGVSASYVVKQIFNNTDSNIVVTVTLSKGAQKSATKDITITAT